MFHFISWMQFGVAVCSAGLLYYLVVLFKYYRQEITAFFSGPKRSAEPTSPPLQPVFGAAKINDAEMNLVSAEELEFAATEPDEIEWPDHQSQLLGEVADFTQELKVLLRIAREADETKENFLMLLRILLGKYPVVCSERYADPLIADILEQAADLPFELSRVELETEFLYPLNND